jgi:hypothetical protein
MKSDWGYMLLIFSSSSSVLRTKVLIGGFGFFIYYTHPIVPELTVITGVNVFFFNLINGRFICEYPIV